MSLGEINRKIESSKRVKETELKNNLFYIHSLANLNASSISRLFSKNAKYPNLYDCFPEIFKVEKKEYEKLQEKRKMEALYNYLMFKANNK